MGKSIGKLFTSLCSEGQGTYGFECVTASNVTSIATFFNGLKSNYLSIIVDALYIHRTHVALVTRVLIFLLYAHKGIIL